VHIAASVANIDCCRHLLQ